MFAPTLLSESLEQANRDEVRLLYGKEIGEERTRLLKAIDGEAFPPFKSLPRDMTHILEEAARGPGNF